jgi:hypothetical protein
MIPQALLAPKAGSLPFCAQRAPNLEKTSLTTGRVRLTTKGTSYLY